MADRSTGFTFINLDDWLQNRLLLSFFLDKNRDIQCRKNGSWRRGKDLRRFSRRLLFCRKRGRIGQVIKAMLDDGLLSTQSETKPVIGLSIDPYRPYSYLDLVLANVKRSWRQAWFEVN